MGREITTYRYVRVSIVGVVMLLFTALLLEIAADGWLIGPSISAYYYTSVRSVFVGSLVAAAFLLVAVRGRVGLEDGLLNLGGMLLPVVAFIPTPLVGACADEGACVPEDFVPGAELSMSALLLLGVPGLAFALWTLLARDRDERAAPSGYLGAVAIWAAFAVWFGPTADWPLRASLLELGHYVAAVGVFVMMVAVAVINARRTDRTAVVADRVVPYTRVYIAVAAVMGIVLAAAVGAWWLGAPAGGSIIFWLEAALLGLFSLFWAIQTAEFWNLGVPEDA